MNKTKKIKMETKRAPIIIQHPNGEKMELKDDGSLLIVLNKDTNESGLNDVITYNDIADLIKNKSNELNNE